MKVAKSNFTNAQVAEKLREITAALTLKKGNLFQIRAYDNAADSIEHSTSEVQDLWEQNQLDQIPGVGESLKNHLEELFKTGEVKHWETLKKGIPPQVFKFLEIPGVGPKTALKLGEMGIKSEDDLKEKIQSGKLVKDGFSQKAAEKILSGLGEAAAVKSGRMLLPYAFAQAENILSYLRKSPEIKKADALGSLRRMMATIGDLDFAVASDSPKGAVKKITTLPGIARVVDQGETKVTLELKSGLHLDFLIVKPESFGALLQHFTGSKQHNIHLRTIAAKKGYSLSEYGVKQIKDGGVIKCETEEELYDILGMQTPAPEIREDMGEIEAALSNKLPKLIELNEIKGDLHIHSNFPIEPSHDLGSSSVTEILKKVKGLGYEYIGIADHNPSAGNHTPQQIIELIKKRKKYIEQQSSSVEDIRVLNLLEVDILPNGFLPVPTEGLKLLDFAMAGIHSSHRMPKDRMTARIMKALENPTVKVLTHPTGRLLNQRDSFEADWETIFKFAAKNKKAMEINAYPNRLDLPDTLVRLAKSIGVRFVIGTDSHSLEWMENMKFGVAVARRGWATQEDIVSSWGWKKFREWFNIRI